MDLKKLFAFAADLLFPPRCVFCGCVVSPGARICGKCAEEAVRTGEVRYMNLSADGENIKCAALYAYRGVVRKSIVDFKFTGRRECAGFYAQKLAEQIPESFPGVRFDAVVSVPISAERKRKRGYNQSELLAKELARLLCVPYLPLLQKEKDNLPQHSLPKGMRCENVRGVYTFCGKKQDVSGRPILLVDDIVTTGNTLHECSRLLKRAGVTNTVCAAVASVE